MVHSLVHQCHGAGLNFTRCPGPAHLDVSSNVVVGAVDAVEDLAGQRVLVEEQPQELDPLGPIQNACSDRSLRLLPWILPPNYRPKIISSISRNVPMGQPQDFDPARLIYLPAAGSGVQLGQLCQQCGQNQIPVHPKCKVPPSLLPGGSTRVTGGCEGKGLRHTVGGRKGDAVHERHIGSLQQGAVRDCRRVGSHLDANARAR